MRSSFVPPAAAIKPRVRYTPILFDHVRITDAFWSGRARVNHERSLPKQYGMCERTGRFNALRLRWEPGQPDRPHIFWDSDTAKWLEAACYACKIREDAGLRAKIEEVTRLFVSAQQPDGYINSYFSQIDTDRRWKNLRYNHELYCAGHIIEAAVAHHELTGQDYLLKAACRYADYIDSVFGLGEGKIPGYCGHQEIELALVRLYRATGEPRYLRLASYFVEQRGQQPLYFKTEVEGVIPADFQGHGFVDDYVQAHLPVREQREVTGHAVRAAYWYCGVADVAAEMEDVTLFEAVERLWENATEKKMYVTGGIGSSWIGETFSTQYDLPNERAYCETCASVALIFWAHRMFQCTGEAKYAHVIERALYNGALAGMSLDGESFFYQNPLASFGEHHRQSWFECSCCPSNLSRLLATLGSYIYASQADELRVLLYVSGEARIAIAGGGDAILTQSGSAPWGGRARFEWTLATPREIEIRFRVPEWTDSLTATVNGVQVKPEIADEYAIIRRTWESGDVITLDFSMPIRRVRSHPLLASNSGQVALQRGPFVYCIEETDFSGSVFDVTLPGDAELEPERLDGLLEGFVALTGTALRTANSSKQLYSKGDVRKQETIHFRAIPYFAWDNRGPGTMRVWIAES